MTMTMAMAMQEKDVRLDIEAGIMSKNLHSCCVSIVEGKAASLVDRRTIRTRLAITTRTLQLSISHGVNAVQAGKR